ncbi:MAG: 1-deoxy-D-xylulose-5-phosphate synthase [Clostridia bacterium]|nr:1-deoxy-D-xylulose-5-phosphate synthase [Clostridia bacterium]
MDIKKVNKKLNIPLLDNIDSPADLKAVSEKEIPFLCQEIRDVLVSGVTENGGHLSSNLGVVELSVAIHRVFNSPEDHIIFDVGHQSYVHKLLTGRKKDFSSLRKGGGISGFPKRSESEHDAFGTGHSSTSLSAGLGFAEADKLKGSDAYTVVVLGDGAFTGGMIHEALNNCKKALRLILVINENEMSISKNTGLFARNLSKLRASPGYYKAKGAVEIFFEHIPLIGKPIIALLSAIKRKFKKLFYGSNYFEQLGFSYFGPADGNREDIVEDYLRAAKARKKCCVVHLKTVKGKGYEPAEKTPDKYHGLAPINSEAQEHTFSSEMGRILTEIADKDERVCAITAAMMQGTGLTAFKEKHPKRFYDVGIAEEHAVTFASGLSANGYLPAVAVYSTFMQRAYDNIIHDVALQRLPVLFLIDRAGLNPRDGATHHGIFDVSFFLEIPNVDIWAPLTFKSLEKRMAGYFSDKDKRPTAIRYQSGGECSLIKDYTENDKTVKIAEGVYADFDSDTVPDNIVITYGRILSEAIKAKAETDKSVGIIAFEHLSDLDKLCEAVIPFISGKNIIFAEEGIYSGSFSMNLASRIYERSRKERVTVLAIKDDFVIQDREESIFVTAKIDKKSIMEHFV